MILRLIIIWNLSLSHGRSDCQQHWQYMRHDVGWLPSNLSHWCLPSKLAPVLWSPLDWEQYEQQHKVTSWRSMSGSAQLVLDIACGQFYTLSTYEIWIGKLQDDMTKYKVVNWSLLYCWSFYLLVAKFIAMTDKHFDSICLWPQDDCVLGHWSGE